MKSDKKMKDETLSVVEERKRSAAPVKKTDETRRRSRRLSVKHDDSDEDSKNVSVKVETESAKDERVSIKDDSVSLKEESVGVVKQQRDESSVKIETERDEMRHVKNEVVDLT